jgi:glycosyltransferase involved in cell wall biosynthesis
MPDSCSDGATPRVCIVLPTYNRAKFVPQAFASIRAQTFADWELVVVDDGSTDNTGELVAAFQKEVGQTVHYVHQPNQGAYAARNTGLDRARGRYVAFFDSDDAWMPHHLADCVTALDANPDVDWVHGAGRIVDHGTGKVLSPNSFYVDGQPRPFFKLRAQARGTLRIIDDPAAIECHILNGLYCGLQKSVLRRSLFDGLRFAPQYDGLINEGEDQLFVVRALARGCRIGYFDNVHLVYYVHAENSSGASATMSVDKKMKMFEVLARAYADLADEVGLTRPQRRALRKRLSRDYFWGMGYWLLWSNGRRREALRMFRRGLAWWPYDLRYWKTYLLALARSAVARRPAACP